MMIPAFSESCPAFAGLFFCDGCLKHADFPCETMALCRFSGVEADFAVKFSIFRALEFVFTPVPAQVRNRKLVLMAPKFRKNHEMHGLSGAIFHILHGRCEKGTRNSEKSVRRRTFLTAKMLICDIFFIEHKRKAPHVQGPHAMGAFTIPRVSAVGH